MHHEKVLEQTTFFKAILNNKYLKKTEKFAITVYCKLTNSFLRSLLVAVTYYVEMSPRRFWLTVGGLDSKHGDVCGCDALQPLGLLLVVEPAIFFCITFLLCLTFYKMWTSHRIHLILLLIISEQ